MQAAASERIGCADKLSHKTLNIINGSPLMRIESHPRHSSLWANTRLPNGNERKHDDNTVNPLANFKAFQSTIKNPGTSEISAARWTHAKVRRGHGPQGGFARTSSVYKFTKCGTNKKSKVSVRLSY